MDPATLLALVGQCAGPENPPALVYAVAKAESGGHPFIIRDNTTGTVHRFHSYSAALTFVKAHARHSLDIGLMQINTKAHKVRPEKVLAPCENVREGSEILSRDLDRSGQNLRAALCLYHRGKINCGDYPEKVLAFFPGQIRKVPQRDVRMFAKKPSRLHPPGATMTPERMVPVFDLADTTPEKNTSGEDPSKELDPRFKSADVDGFMGR